MSKHAMPRSRRLGQLKVAATAVLVVAFVTLFVGGATGMIGSRDDGGGPISPRTSAPPRSARTPSRRADSGRHRRRHGTRRRTDRDRHRRAPAERQGRQEAQAVAGLAAPRPGRRDDVPRRHLQRARQLAHRQVRRQQARLRVRRHPDGHGLLADQPGRPRRGRLPGVRGPAVRPVPLARRLAVGRLPRPLPRPRLDPRLDRLAHRRVEAGRGQQHRHPLLRRRPDPAPRDQAREHRVRPRGVVLQHPQPRVHAQPRQQRALARRGGRASRSGSPTSSAPTAPRSCSPATTTTAPRCSARSSGAPSSRPRTAAATPAAATPPTGMDVDWIFGSGMRVLRLRERQPGDRRPGQRPPVRLRPGLRPRGAPRWRPRATSPPATRRPPTTARPTVRASEPWPTEPSATSAERLLPSDCSVVVGVGVGVGVGRRRRAAAGAAAGSGRRRH